ncbi:MAG: HEAT repeat domain-containing protein [Phycisphaerae bacterium]
MLRSENSSKREYAAQVLGGFGSEQTIEPLIEALQDSETRVRIAATKSLAELGDRRAIGPLIQALDNEGTHRLSFDELLKKVGREEAGKRANATRTALETMIKTLCRFADKQAVETLLKRLVDNDPYIRQLAAESLNNLGEPKWQQWIHGGYNDFEQLGKSEDPKAIELLLLALTRGHLTDQAAVIKAVSELGDTAAVEPLITALNTQWSVCAAMALGKLRDQRAVVPLINALKSPTCATEAAYALGNIGDKRAVESLIKALGSSATTAAAATALGQLNDKRAVEPLLQMLENESNIARGAIMTALGRLGDCRVIEPLVKLLGDHNPEIRRLSAGALANLGKSKWLQYFKGKNEDDFWRLGSSRDPAAIQPLLFALNGPDPAQRRLAVKAIGQTGDKKALEPLLRMLSSPDLCMDAVESLGELGDHNAIDPLVRLLNDPNVGLRKNAAIALGKLNARQAIPVLKEKLKDADWFVRKASAESLYRLGEQEVRLDEEPIPTMKVLSHCYGPMGLYHWECLGMCVNCSQPFLFRLGSPPSLHSRQGVTRYECNCGQSLYATTCADGKPVLTKGCRVVEGRLRLENPVNLILEDAGHITLKGAKLPEKHFVVTDRGDGQTVML